MIDWSKPVQTRDGRKLEVLTTERIDRDGFCVVATCTEADGYQTVLEYTRDGHNLISKRSADGDAVNIVERTSYWINLCPNGGSTTFSCREAADFVASFNRKGVVRIDYEDGIPVSACIEY